MMITYIFMQVCLVLLLLFLIALLFQLKQNILFAVKLCSAGDIIEGRNLDTVIACLEYLLESSSL